MTDTGGPKARPGAPQIIRLALKLPYSDLGLTDKAGGAVELDDSQFLLALVLPYGLGPDEPHAFTTDAAGRLLVSGASAAPLTVQGAVTAAILAAQSSALAVESVPPGMWTAVSNPAAGAQATASRAAGAAGVRHVCTAILVTFGAIAAPAATALTWALRDGASGAGAILAQGQVAVPGAVFQGQPVFLSDLAIPGSAATAMTLEFSAALANLLEGVTLFGFDAS